MKPVPQWDERFRLLLEASPAGIILVDAKARILLINERIESWFGYSREELVGQFIEVLVPDSVRPHHIPLRDGYLRAPTVRPIGSNRDLTARRKDGSEFPCDISLHPLPLPDELQVMVHIVDITERRRLEAERRQQESHRRLRFMIDNLPAGAVYVSGPVIAANRATEAITGYTRQELHTLESWFGQLFGERAAEVQAQYEADRILHFPKTRTLEIIRKDKQRRWIELAAYGDDQHEVWLLYDVTERIRAQDQVVQSERLAAIGEMMTALAHESRNALQRSQACLEMLEVDLEQQPEELDLVQRAQRAVDELQRLYEEVREYAAPLRLELQSSNLRELWRQVWANLTPSMGTKSITFQDDCPLVPVADVDRHRFCQVLRNIFENSIAALPATGGMISLTSETISWQNLPGLQITLRDNGSGMSPEQRARLFEPFFTTKARGTGLGMPIARRIMEAHHGEIELGPLLAGTEIVLRLPTVNPSVPTPA